MLERRSVGACHNVSVRYFLPYAVELSGHTNARAKDTHDQRHDIALSMERERLRHDDLTRQAEHRESRPSSDLDSGGSFASDRSSGWRVALAVVGGSPKLASKTCRCRPPGHCGRLTPPPMAA